ncbi:hypothetical protein GU926_15835 [Nibribacter ruber]|uniref:Carboxypeptidase regulatory-like domain-containing protein n=1 Tax=Nibribacter ruber TaxID=2698458 RepID=A0A6P1P374_9BACT|nr:carboxypeptidase regulatory-like domain-containing protein [Nibribacter ruber]QHL88815.1 hypothetical protein GU926_15835 [Nibribacter ruber]
MLLIFVALLNSNCSPKTIRWQNGNRLAVMRTGIMDTATAFVSGKVLDLDYHLGIKGAQVTIENEQYAFSSTCGKDGIFKFGHLPPGKYTLKTTFIGFYTLNDTVDFKAGEIVKLKIELGTD